MVIFKKSLEKEKNVARSVLCLCLCEHAERSDLCPGTNAFLWRKKAKLCVTGTWLSAKENEMCVLLKPLF